MAENTLYKTCLEKAMALCSRREYCTEDVLSKLKSWGLDEISAGKIIESLINENFLNETRYSSAFVRDKFNYNKWGKVKISSHLRIKKIPVAVIKSALDNIEDELYRKTLKDLLASHRKSIKSKNQYELKGKLLRFGLSRGFESNLLYDLLNEIE